MNDASDSEDLFDISTKTKEKSGIKSGDVDSDDLVEVSAKKDRNTGKSGNASDSDDLFDVTVKKENKYEDEIFDGFVDINFEFIACNPFPAIDSKLCTLIICRFIGKENSFAILRLACHKSRAYCWA